MTITLLTPTLTPEAECVMAYCRWHQIKVVVDTGYHNLAHTGGSGVPAIKVHEPGKDDFKVRGFHELCDYVRKKGCCLI